ncbi:SWIM zinc finger family protein [Deinococcus sp.]|uniref:SWIM zinc finger family protein n=1 Tax=Deinococcus sp. TaxID=47478 RepID=UPI0025C41CD2|nr:SWIM zinc finger family protein [Deinococcus sp.]
MTLTPETILALAPDSGSAANGKKLATPARWPALHTAPGLLWGEAQGSGKNPYLVGVDLNGYVSKCSCPSRKFPCKHALALMLLYAADAGRFSEQAAPESLGKWLEGRTQRTERSEQAGETPRKEADPAQHAKSWAKREKKMSDGLAALELWLSDLVREGLLAARERSYGEWDGQAARMIDAQLPGVARLARQIPGLLHGESGEGLTAHLGRLYLLTQGWHHRGGLSSGERADLLTTLGLPLDKSALTRSDTDSWLCVGIVTEEEGHLTVRRTWLLGDTGEVALLLDFSPKNMGLGAGFFPLQRLSGALGYAPSAFPQRAVLEGALDSGTGTLPVRHALPLADLPAHWARANAQNPWLERVGVLLGPVYFAEGQACDYAGQAAPLHSAADLWHLTAQANTEPAYAFGEWDGETFLPLTVNPEHEAPR